MVQPDHDIAPGLIVLADGNGLYEFVVQTPRNYCVAFEPPAGFVFSLPNQGDGTDDSKPDPATGQTLGRSAVDSVEDEDGTTLSSTEIVDTRDWVRPGLRGGRPVLRVRRDGGSWVPAERRSKQR